MQSVTLVNHPCVCLGAISHPHVEILQPAGSLEQPQWVGDSTYIKPPRTISAGAGSKGNTLMMLVCYYRCESCSGITGKVRLTSSSEASLTRDAWKQWQETVRFMCWHHVKMSLQSNWALCNNWRFYGPQSFMEVSRGSLGDDYTACVRTNMCKQEAIN